MANYIIRRTVSGMLTLLAISFVLFAILDLAPGDPTANLPPTIPPEVRLQIRESLGFNEPFPTRYTRWLRQFLWHEPLNILEETTGIVIGDSAARTRILSWQTRGPVIDLIIERIPQTLWVLGTAFILGILIAIPVGVISAYRQYSLFDQIGTLVAMIGYSVPTFFTGLLMIIIFSVQLGWFPSFYDTTHKVTNWASFVVQVKQMVMPVLVLAFFNAASLSRFTRSAVLDNLNQDYVCTARSKGIGEQSVVLIHILRNSLIPVVTLIALQLPSVFAGSIITEQIFRVNGIGQLLITAIQGADIPTVQTLTSIYAVLIVFFNLIADIVYGILDPHITYS